MIEYPRNWYRITSFSDVIKTVEMVRETEHYLYWQGLHTEIREKKQTSSITWLPTREEAEAVIAERLAKREEKGKHQQLCDAADDLLNALVDAETLLLSGLRGDGWRNERATVLAKMRAAINKATGGPDE